MLDAHKHKQQPILVCLIKVLGDSWLPIQPPFFRFAGHCGSCKVHSDDWASCERIVRPGQFSALRNGCWRGLSRGWRCDVRADESPGSKSQSAGWRGW